MKWARYLIVNIYRLLFIFFPIKFTFRHEIQKIYFNFVFWQVKSNEFIWVCVLTKFSVTFLTLVIERSALAIWKWEINWISTISYSLTEFEVLMKFSVTFLILVIERSALAIWKWEINQISTISYDLTKFDIWRSFL